jgi:hypothetical protein
MKHDGTPFLVLSKTKINLKKKVDNGNLTEKEAFFILKKKTDPTFVGDNLFNSYKKNYITLLKNLQLIDDDGHLSEQGMNLHRVGKLHGQLGETFKNCFTNILCFEGKHLELILDVEKLTRNVNFNNVQEAISFIHKEYIKKGLFKPNPGRGDGKKTFLKYERIIWGHLGLLDKINRGQYTDNAGFNFNWHNIAKICSI